jgi:hypothetical protein
MEDRSISRQESMMIIQSMIQAAKKEQKDDGKGWIIWGWLLFLASVTTYLNIRYQWFNAFFFWNIFGILSIFLLAFSSFQKFFAGRTERVKTYTRDLFDKLNTGFFIFLLLIIVSMNTGGVNPIQGFALLLGLYGFWILIYGAALNFKPSVIGAFITWMFAFASLFVKNFEHTMLLHAAAVLCGYIIPGHMANSSFKKAQPANTGV